MVTLETTVAAHPFWQGLDPRLLPPLTRYARLLRFGVGDPIFQERHQADHLYLVQSGQVTLETFVPGHGVTTLQILSAGEALGWSWLFPPYRWQFGARSTDVTEIIAFDGAALRGLAGAHPAFGQALVTRMAQVLLCRLQATCHKLQEFHHPDAGQGLDECLRVGEEAPADPPAAPSTDTHS